MDGECDEGAAVLRPSIEINLESEKSELDVLVPRGFGAHGPSGFDVRPRLSPRLISALVSLPPHSLFHCFYGQSDPIHTCILSEKCLPSSPLRHHSRALCS